MARLRFDEADLILVDTDLNVRQSVKNILHNKGFRQLRLGRTVADIRSMLEDRPADLLISEAVLPDEDFGEFVHSLRHHENDYNPFIPIIVLLQEPTPHVVTRMVSAGVDDILIKPVSTGQMLDRIKNLIVARKHFVVTSEYIGPERRQKGSDRGKSAPCIEVPNTLKARVTGDTQFMNVQSAIDQAIRIINNHKLESHASQIEYLLDQMDEKLERMEIDDEVLGHMDRLRYVAEDTGRRMSGTKYAHVFDLCESLINVSRRICHDGYNANPRDIQLLKPLGEAIQAGFDTDEKTAEVAREISTTVR